MLEESAFLRYTLGFWIQVVPVAALCYQAFGAEDYRIPPKRALFLNLGAMLLLSLLESGIWVVNETLKGSDYEAAFSMNSSIFYVFLLLCFFIFCVCVRSTGVKKLLVFAMGFTYAVFIASSANAYFIFFPVLSFWNKAAENGVMLQGGSLYIIFALECLTLPLMLLFMRRMVRPVLRIMDTRTSRYICGAIILMLLLYCVSYTRVTFDFEPVALVFYCLTLCVFCSFGIFFFTAKQMNKNREDQERARQLEHQVQIEELNYRNITASLGNARLIRHDVRHHLRLMGEMAGRGDTAAIQAYIEAYDHRIQSEGNYAVCENYILNSICQYYRGRCEEAGIRFTAEAKLALEPGIPGVDLTVLFSNILENAYNACQGSVAENPFIHLKVGTVANAVVIILKNTTQGAAVGQRTIAELQCKKDDGRHCLGLVSVQGIVDTHDGYAEYHYGEGVFTTKISIQPGPQK